MPRMLLLLWCWPFVAQAQDNEMPFRPEGDSLLPFEKTVKTWYVQSLEEVDKEVHIISTSSAQVKVLVYTTEMPKRGREYHYLVAQQQKYSWKLTEFELGYDHSIDSAYFKEITGKGKPELVMAWSYSLGASGEDFSWNEALKGLIVFDLETSELVLNQILLYEENHYGSSTNEALLTKTGSGFDEQGRKITNEAEQHAVEMKYRQEIFFDKGTMTIVLKALDPDNNKKTIRLWPDVRYAYTSKGWKRIH